MNFSHPSVSTNSFKAILTLVKSAGFQPRALVVIGGAAGHIYQPAGDVPARPSARESVHNFGIRAAKSQADQRSLVS
jgi:hypothetical protein